MSHREIAETLRNPNGPYFADNTPAMLALETMVDTVGIANVLYALSRIASEKADHVATSYNDRQLAKLWIKRSNQCDTLASHTCMHD